MGTALVYKELSLTIIIW